MDRRMAYRACLILRSLAMKIRRSRGSAECGSGVALQADDVQVAGFDQTRIWRAMGRMAGHATLGFDRLVLKNKGSLFVRMAGVADLISRGCRAQLLADKSAVRVVTIRALNQSLFHPMVERHVELRFDLLVTAVTQSGLSLS